MQITAKMAPFAFDHDQAFGPDRPNDATVDRLAGRAPIDDNVARSRFGDFPILGQQSGYRAAVGIAGAAERPIVANRPVVGRGGLDGPVGE